MQERRLLQSLKTYMLSVFPQIFLSTEKPLHRRVLKELSRHHFYLHVMLRVLFPQTMNESQATTAAGGTGSLGGRLNLPVIPMFKILTIQTMLMFLLALLYDLQFPSSQASRAHCFTRLTYSSCLSIQSLVDSSQSVCHWVLIHHQVLVSMWSNMFLVLISRFQGIFTPSLPDSNVST